MAAVSQYRHPQRARQPGQGRAPQPRPRGAGQHAAGEGGGDQTLGLARQTARRSQQLTPLTPQQVGQPRPFGLGRHRPHAPRRAGEVEHASGEDFGAPGERRPAAKVVCPGQGEAQALARAPVALGHQAGHPGEGMELDGEAPCRAGPVPRIGGGLGLEARSGQGEAAAQHALARRRVMGAEVARSRGEGRGLARRQGQAVAGQAIQLDPHLTGQQPAGDGEPQGGSSRRST